MKRCKFCGGFVTVCGQYYLCRRCFNASRVCILADTEVEEVVV